MSTGVDRYPDTSGDPNSCINRPWLSKSSSSVLILGAAFDAGVGGIVAAYMRGNAAFKPATVLLKSGSLTPPLLATSNRMTVRVSGPSPRTGVAAPPMHERFGAPG